jgi:hypothetical protein
MSWPGELHNLYASLNIIWGIKSRWAGHVASMEEMRNAHNNLNGKPEEKRQLRRRSTHMGRY